MKFANITYKHLMANKQAFNQADWKMGHFNHRINGVEKSERQGWVKVYFDGGETLRPADEHAFTHFGSDFDAINLKKVASLSKNTPIKFVGV